MNDRYSAQLGLIGQEGQEKLLKSHVLVVGAGGLGSPVIQYLAAAGVRLTIVDGDVVDESNLNRQVLYRHDMVAEYKAEMACGFARGCNPYQNHVYSTRHMSGDDLRALMLAHDLVVAAVDNMETRFEINDLGVEEDIPVIHGACSGWHGQVMTSPGRSGPCYRCMFEEEASPTAERAGMERGIMGTTCGIVGSFMAQEALKVLLGHKPERGEFLDIDGFHHRVMSVKVTPVTGCKAGDHGSITG